MKNVSKKRVSTNRTAAKKRPAPRKIGKKTLAKRGTKKTPTRTSTFVDVRITVRGKSISGKGVWASIGKGFIYAAAGRLGRFYIVYNKLPKSLRKTYRIKSDTKTKTIAVSRLGKVKFLTATGFNKAIGLLGKV